jgi:hypothetical protein
MSKKLYLLIKLLETINLDETIEINKNIYSIEHPLVNAVVYLAGECLIGEDGHIIRENIDKISSKGFIIYPAEIDNFGWKYGYIKLTYGDIYF